MKGDDILALLRRWRSRDEAKDRGAWHTAKEVASALKVSPAQARKALHQLADDGAIERGTFTNGIFFQAKKETA